MMTTINARILTTVVVQGLLAGSLLLADTLSLKSGETLEGTFSNGNQNEIIFSSNGVTRRYSIQDVKALEFASVSTALNISRRWRVVDNSWVHFVYPANWQISDEGDRILLNSNNLNRRFRGDIGSNANVIVGMHREWGSEVQGLRGSLEGETNKILAGLGGMMRNMRQSGSPQQFQLDGQRALKSTFTTMSSGGVRELNWLITSMHPQGVVYLVLSGPERDFASLEGTFQQMQNSLKIVR